MFGKIGEIVDGVENGVDRLRNIIVHVVRRHLLGFNLLRGNFTMGSKMIGRQCD